MAGVNGWYSAIGWNHPGMVAAGMGAYFSVLPDALPADS